MSQLPVPAVSVWPWAGVPVITGLAHAAGGAGAIRSTVAWVESAM
ncbi:MAG: hypothetical protein WBQ18_16220 [Solirubrobacteraceae bacterium]